jgi:hypothetical protein
MKKRNRRAFRLLASVVTAAALAAPVIAAAGSNGKSVEPTSPVSSNPILRNDIRHFGNQDGLSGEFPAPIVVRVDGGFDWVSAGVGAAGGVGLVLVAGAATATLRRRRPVEAAQI